MKFRTIPMDQSPSHAIGCSAGQEIQCLMWKLKVH